MKLSKDTVQALLKRKTKQVKIGDYDINIVELTIPQQLEIESILKDNKSNGDLLKYMIKHSVVDDNLDLVFDDNVIDQLPASFAANLFKECVDFNELNDKRLESKAKNF